MGEDNKQKPIGRPLIDNPKEYYFKIRQSYDDRRQLQAMSNFLDMTKAEVIREAMSHYEDYLTRVGYDRNMYADDPFPYLKDKQDI